MLDFILEAKKKLGPTDSLSCVIWGDELHLSVTRKYQSADFEKIGYKCLVTSKPPNDMLLDEVEKLVLRLDKERGKAFGDDNNKYHIRRTMCSARGTEKTKR